MLPPEPGAKLRAALKGAAGALGLTLEAGQSRQLLDYLDLMERWNRVYNLSAIRDREAMLVQHIVDCLAAVGPLRRHTQGRPARLLDVGSGAGLPGVVLAIAMPELDVSCVDAVGKKVAFIREVAAALGLPNLHALHARVERIEDAAFDIISSRAFSSLGDFVSLTRRLGHPRTVWLAMKGRPPSEEIEALPADFRVFHVERLGVPGLDAQRCLVWIGIADRTAARAAIRAG